jgi:class 3 adenylate cyclase
MGHVPGIADLERARRALEAHAWQEAFDALAPAAERNELGAQDLERFGEAAWWSARPAEFIDAFERAYAAHLAEGARERAALVAIRLGLEYADRMETALWNGWLQRANRLLAECPESVEHGYLEMALVRSSADRGDLDAAMQHARRGHEIGTRFGDRDLVAFGLVLEGAILVFQAQLEQGLALIDEGTLEAVGGDLTPYAAGSIYCITIGVCRGVADYGRAAEWTEAASRWCERQSITGFPGVCRVQRAEIMKLRGEYPRAEDEARRALAELTAFGRLPQAGAGGYEVGEVRLRLGDLEGAEEAFGQAHRLGRDPQPGLALLHLARGRVQAAKASIDTALVDQTDPLERARLLPARVEIALAEHDLAGAREAADELGGIAERYGMPMLRAAAHQARGATFTFEEDATAAVVELRAAVRHWTEVEAPFEAAQARRWLAVAHRAAGDETSAAMELRAAEATFDGLGARLEVERCAELIRAGQEGRSGRRVSRTFMFTDIVGSTDLVRTIGDEAWEDVLRWHDETMRSLIASHGGEVVHGTGDGFFASFADVAAAAACAVTIQRRLAEHRRRHGFAPQVRIGLHADEATVVGEDYAGLGVHEAARVGALAQGGEIVVTTSSLVDAPIAFPVTNERQVVLKGLAEPVPVASVDWSA